MRFPYEWLVVGAAFCLGCGEDFSQDTRALDGPVNCAVTAGGELTNGDVVGGSGRQDLGEEATGSWNHLIASGGRAVCSVTSVSCFSDGGGGAGPPQEVYNVALLELECSFNGDPGFLGGLFVADRGEPATRDEYSFSLTGPDGSIAYESIDTLLDTGNIQIRTP